MKKLFVFLLMIIFFFLINKSSTVALSNKREVDVKNNKESFENWNTPVIALELKTGNIIYANEKAIEFYGYEKNELLNKNINDLEVNSGKNVLSTIPKVECKNCNNFIFNHKLKNGDVKQVQVYTYPVVNPKGESLIYYAIYDIAEKIALEKRLSFNRMLLFSLLASFIVILFVLYFYLIKSKKKIESNNKNLQSLFDNMQEGFALHEIICNEKGNPMDYAFLDINKKFEQIMNLKKEDIIGRRVKEILPKTENYWIEKYGEIAVNGGHTNFIEYSIEVDKYFSVSVYSPQKNQFATIFIDITDQIKSSSKLKSERNLLETTIQSLGEGVISSDKKGKIDIMNSVAEILTGWKKSDVHNKSIYEILNVYNEYKNVKIEEILNGVFSFNNTIISDNDTFLKQKNGKKIPIDFIASPIKDHKNKNNGLVFVFRDYTEKKLEQEKILYLSYHDQLTGLYNRRFFEEELKRLDTERNLPFTIAMVDVNGLKLTNDAFGHMMGDELLKKVSNIIKNECRSDDIIARIGGDEFVILFPKTGEKETHKIVERIYNAISNEKLENIIISVSIGWATKYTPDQIMSDVFIKAEEYMYRKKLTETQSMRNQTIMVILNTLNEKNEREKIHSEKVSLIAKKIGEAMNLDYESIKEIEIAGLMHDIGKISVDQRILNKVGILTETEYNDIKKHTEIGYQILKSVDEYSSLAEYVLCHHERWDGTGYPRGLKGQDIPLISRIITLADAYEAMVSERNYKIKKTREEALIELEENSDKHFDYTLVKIFKEKVYPSLEI